MKCGSPASTRKHHRSRFFLYFISFKVIKLSEHTLEQKKKWRMQMTLYIIQALRSLNYIDVPHKLERDQLWLFYYCSVLSYMCCDENIALKK